jgi:hypothetical protein
MKSGGVDKRKNNHNRGKREEAVPGTKVSIPTQSSQGKCEADVPKMEMQVATEKPVLESSTNIANHKRRRQDQQQEVDKKKADEHEADKKDQQHECAKSDDSVDFSMLSSDASDDQTSDNGKLSTEYGRKISELLLKYDKRLMLKN